MSFPEFSNEKSASDFMNAMKRFSLRMAARNRVNGGPKNNLEVAIDQLASVSGNTQAEIEAETEKITPKIIKP